MSKYKFNKKYKHIFFSIFILLILIIFLKINLAPVNFQINVINSVIVPHGDYANDMRIRLFNEIKANNSPETIIILSPDHYDASPTLYASSDQEWSTQAGILNPDKSLIYNLEVPINNQAFINEHGIKNLLYNIKTTFPESKIVPIIINQNITQGDTEKLFNTLNKNCLNCLLIASVDFSHYNSLSVAKLHDDFTIQALQNLDQENIWQAEVDSNAALYIATKWSKNNSDKSFRIVDHQNSLDNTVDKSVESTSFITGYFTKYYNSPVSNPATSFTIGGTWHNTDLNLTNLQNSLGNRVFWGTQLKSMTYSKTKLPSLDQYLKINSSLNLNDLNSPEIYQINSPIQLTQISIDLDKNNFQILSDTIFEYSKQNTFIIVNIYRKSGTTTEDLNNSINSGADLVIGNQLAALPTLSYYQDKPTINTLGNLNDENNISLIISGKVTDEELYIVFSPIKIINRLPKLAIGNEKTDLINQIVIDKTCSLNHDNNDTIIINRK